MAFGSWNIGRGCEGYAGELRPVPETIKDIKIKPIVSLTNYCRKGSYNENNLADEMEVSKSSFFDSGDEKHDKIDGFLVRELHDLDIPLAGSVNHGLEVETEAKDQFESGANKYVFDNSMFLLKHDLEQVTHGKMDCRELGEAGIFGFGGCDSPGRETNERMMIESSTPGFEGNSASSNKLSLMRQKELGLALEKQKEVNRRLQEQLKINQMQKQQLQNALKEKEAKFSQNFTRPMNETPTNSNEKSGSYKFLSSKDEQNLTSLLPLAEVLVPGSEHENDCNRIGLGLMSSLTGTASNQGLGPILHKNIQELPMESLDYFESSNHQDQICKSPVNIYQALFSPQSEDSDNSSPSSPYKFATAGKHGSSGSVVFTSSDIPTKQESESDTELTTNRFGQVPAIRPGLQCKDQNLKQTFILNNPPALELMPLLPDSVDNTPVKCNLESPCSLNFRPKYNLQHTFVKESNQRPVKIPMTEMHNSPIRRDIFDSMGTSSFTFPSESYAAYMSSSPSDDNCRELNQDFIQTPSLSPVLLSQNKLIDQPHNIAKYGNNSRLEPFGIMNSVSNHSPARSCSKKASNLPQNEIDQYIKKLEDKAFECLYLECGKLFKRRYNIRSHIQTHLEDRPFKCDFEGCLKAFVRNHDLIRHKKTHTQKLFVCVCGKRFGREDALLTHRTRMICIGGKKFDNIVIKKSPRKRGRPKKDAYSSVNGSLIKEIVSKDYNGISSLKIEEQLQNELVKKSLQHISERDDKSKKYSEQDTVVDVRTPVSLTSPYSFSAKQEELSPNIFNYEDL